MPNPNEVISRRKFLEKLGVAAAAVVLPPVIFVECPQGPGSKNTNAPLTEAGKSELNPIPHTLSKLFIDTPTLERELAKTPIQVMDISVETDGDGVVNRVHSIVGPICERDRAGIGRRLYVSSKGQDGKFSPHLPVSEKPLPLAAFSIISRGNNISITGEQTEASSTPVGIFSTDGGKNFVPLKMPFQHGDAREQVIVPGTTKAIINLSGNNPGSMAILDLQTWEMVPVEGKDTRLGLTLVSVSPDKTTANVFVNAFTDTMGTGYLEKTINLETGKVENSTLMHQELGFIYGFAPLINNNGDISKIYTTNSDGNLFIVDGATGVVSDPKPYRGWFDGKNIPNLAKGSGILTIFNLEPCCGKRIWAGGAYPSTVDGEFRSLLFSWPLDKDPDTDPEAIDTVYILDNISKSAIAKPQAIERVKMDQTVKWVKMSENVYGLLLNVNDAGLFFVQTDQFGNPIGKDMLCLNNGLFG